MKHKKLKKDLVDNMYFTLNDGKIIFIEENAITALFDADILFPISREDVDHNYIITLALNCNDVFWWAYSDLEFVSMSDIQSLYESCFDKEGNYIRWGSTKWICIKRQMRPQHPIEDNMKKDNCWSDELEVLPVRENTG